MKNLKKFFVIAVLLVTASLCFVGCNFTKPAPTEPVVPPTEPTTPTEPITPTPIAPITATFNGFDKIDETTFSIKVSNTTEYLNIATIASINASWKLTTDMQAQDEIPSKIATPLAIGDNTFYVLATNNDDLCLYTLKIRRKPIYQVEFNTDGGNAIATQSIEEDSFLSIPIEPTKIGYTFIAWDCSLTEPITANMVIDSIWEANTYTITYVANDGTAATQTQDVTFDTANVILKDQNCFSRVAYNFVKWNTAADGSGTNYSANSNFGDYNMPNDMTLYAIWQPINYSITYHVNDTTIKHSNTIKTYNAETPTITLQDATRTGYNFEGWYTDSEFQNQISRIEVGSYGNLDLYVKFTANKYIITLNANGGNLDQNTLEVTYGQPYELPVPTREGEWAFAGWNIQTKGTWKWTDKTSVTASWLPFYTYTLLDSGDAYELTRYRGDEELVDIPNTYNGLPVTRIGVCAFYNCVSLTHLVIPENITEIGKNAFANTSALKKVDFNAVNMKDLGRSDAIFLRNKESDYADKKIAVSIGANVTRIPAYLFCYDLSVAGGYSQVPLITTVEFMPGSICKSIGAYAFETFATAGISTSYMATFTFPNTITEIGEYAFRVSYMTLIIPDSVTKIGKCAFCNSVTIYTELAERPEDWAQECLSYGKFYWAGEWHYDETTGEPVPN